MSKSTMTTRIGLCVLTAMAVVSTAGFAADPAFELRRGVEYVRRGDKSLKADVYLPRSAAPRPGVLLVHGGAWMSGARTQMAGIAEELAKNGYATVSIDYRLAPQHQFPAQIEDCREALSWLHRRAGAWGIAADRLGAFGYSAGGQLVSLLACEPADGARANRADAKLRAVVAGGAPCDFRLLPKNNRLLAYWLGGSRGEQPDRYVQASPLQFASADDPPFFFYHGGKDTLVPIFSPRAMSARLGELGVECRLYEVEGASHLRAFFDRGAIREAIGFLDAHLKPAAAAPTAAARGSDS